MSKPVTFNYQEYVRVCAELDAAHQENIQLRAMLEVMTDTAAEYRAMLEDLCCKCNELFDNIDRLTGVEDREETQNVKS